LWRCGPRVGPGVTFHALESVGDCEGMNLHTPKWTPTLGIGVLMDSLIFREWLQGSKPIGLKSSFYHWKALGIQMSKMGSHDPFRYLKHKLWPKERLGVKLPIWLPTTKSWESLWFPHVEVACHISLERSWLRLQLCLKPHFNWWSTHKVMGLQFWEFRDSHLGVLGQNDIWMLALWQGTKNTIKGKVVASPKSELWWVLSIRVCPWFVRAPKVLQLHTNQLVIWVV
jgi:hypothetical protein